MRRRQVWALYVSMAAGVLSVVALIRGDLRWAVASVVLTVGAGKAARVWSRKDPGPMPRFMRGRTLGTRTRLETSRESVSPFTSGGQIGARKALPPPVSLPLSFYFPAECPR